ncbi:MAG TPA: hypothetical protein VKY37_02690 [Brumimicrobium sp.]|nr:hypothetical protein [Brumimicrobium sp.]
MNILALEIFEEHEKCTFYTIRQVLEEDEDLPSETEKFFRKFYADDNYKECVEEILDLLDYIGEKRGANIHLFRPESKADGLPKNEKKLCNDLCLDFAHFPLRLYCLRITDEILILFNGGIKDAGKAQQSKSSMAFNEAQIFCTRIHKAFVEKEIRIEGNKIVGNQEIIEL